jgi:hypothetical protein
VNNVKNYDGSWTEWGKLVAAPIEKGDVEGALPSVKSEWSMKGDANMQMTILDRIQELHRADPFRAFQISLDDGRRVLIDRPEFLGIFSRRDRIFYSTPEDTTEVVELERVARVGPAGKDRPRRRGKE